MASTLAIVGRPNVGKSTLFNRLIGQRKSIVDNISGVTRDRVYGTSDWNGKTFTVIDTGGFVKNSDDVFETAIREQVDIAIEEADILLFMVDVTTGITDLDDEVANKLRRTKKPVFVVVNKVDNHQLMLDANEFWSLGFENTFFVSSMTGSGTGEVLDAISELIQEEKPIEEDIPKFAIIGRPNVGKSSLINALIGEERNIVTNIAGTTRDTVHTRYNKFGKDFLLIDTAGIRKKAKVQENIEFYSVIRAVNAIDEADVCLIMIDAQTGIEHQDMAIINLAVRRHKGIALLVNKWDLIEKETNTARDYAKELRKKLAPFDDVPIVFISVLNKQRIFKTLEVAIKVYENRSKKIQTSVLNEVMQEIIDIHPPPSHRGLFVKIKYITQLPTYYPAFAFFCNYPKYIKESYKNFLENQLRENFDFEGVPISIFFRKK